MSDLYTTGSARASTTAGSGEQPQLVFVPDQMLRTVKLTNEPLKTFLDLDLMFKIFGVNGTATFVFLNSLYNSQSDLFLRNETLPGFLGFDLLDPYRDQLKEKPTLSEDYAQLIKVIDGLKITKPEYSDSFLKDVEGVGNILSNDMVESTPNTKQYYVPELFVISERIYGVRLKAVTSLINGDLQETLKQATVANIGLLSNSYDIRQLASLPVIKQFVALCR